MDIYQNDEERQQIVGLALMVADGASAAGPNTARILAHEVRTLRKELESVNTQVKGVFTKEFSVFTKEFNAELLERTQECDRLRATIKRVEELCDEWEEEDREAMNAHDAAAAVRRRLKGSV